MACCKQSRRQSKCLSPRGTCLLIVAALLYSSREYAAKRRASHVPPNKMAGTIAAGPAPNTGVLTARRTPRRCVALRQHQMQTCGSDLPESTSSCAHSRPLHSLSRCVASAAAVHGRGRRHRAARAVLVESMTSLTPPCLMDCSAVLQGFRRRLPQGRLVASDSSAALLAHAQLQDLQRLRLPCGLPHRACSPNPVRMRHGTADWHLKHSACAWPVELGSGGAKCTTAQLWRAQQPTCFHKTAGLCTPGVRRGACTTG